MSLRYSISLGRRDRQGSLPPPVASYLSFNRGARRTLSDVSTDPGPHRDRRSMIASDSPQWHDIIALMNAYIGSSTDNWPIALRISECVISTEAGGREAANQIRINLSKLNSARQYKAARIWGILLRNPSPSFLAETTTSKFLSTVEKTLPKLKKDDAEVYLCMMEVLAHAAYLYPGENDLSSSRSLLKRDKSTGYLALWRKVASLDSPERGIYIPSDNLKFNPPDFIPGAIRFRIQSWALKSADDDTIEARHIHEMTSISEENCRSAMDTLLDILSNDDTYSQLKVLKLLLLFITRPSAIALAHLLCRKFLTALEHSTRSSATPIARDRLVEVIGAAAHAIASCDPALLNLSRMRGAETGGYGTLWLKVKLDTMPMEGIVFQSLDPSLQEFVNEVHPRSTQLNGGTMVNDTLPVRLENRNLELPQLEYDRSIVVRQPDAGRRLSIDSETSTTLSQDRDIVPPPWIPPRDKTARQANGTNQVNNNSNLQRSPPISAAPATMNTLYTLVDEKEPAPVSRDNSVSSSNHSQSSPPAYSHTQISPPLRVNTMFDPLETSYFGGSPAASPLQPSARSPNHVGYPEKRLHDSFQSVNDEHSMGSRSLSVSGAWARWVRACQDYTGRKDGDLYFQSGDIIQVVDRTDDHWWYGIHAATGKSGLFPVHYVESAPEKLVSKASLARALYDFHPDKMGKRGEGELAFRKGQILRIVEENDQLWWTGKLNGRQGLIPAKYMQVIERAPIYDVATTVEAADDFEPIEPGQLRFRKHDKITVLNQGSDRWWTGILYGEVGRFPASMVLDKRNESSFSRGRTSDNARTRFESTNASSHDSFAQAVATSNCKVLVHSEAGEKHNSLHVEVISEGSSVAQLSSGPSLPSFEDATMQKISKTNACVNVSHTAVSTSSTSTLSKDPSELLEVFKKMGLVPKHLQNTDNLEAKDFINLAVEAHSAQWEADLQTEEVTLFQDALSEMISSEACPIDLSVKCQRWIRKVASHTGVLPNELFVENVERNGTIAVAGGGFSDIYKGTYNGKQVALKVLRSFNDNYAIRRAFCVEALFWHHLNHKNVLPMLGVCVEAFKPRLCLVAPWMKHGNIMQYLEAHPKIKPHKLLWQGAEGLVYLHGLDPPLVHGDIKGGNMLIDEEGNVRLTDFGLVTISRTQALATTFDASSEAGSVRWMAAELHNPGAHRSRPSDVFAFGMTMLEVFTGKVPFADFTTDYQVLLAIIKNQFPSRPSEDSTRGLTKEVWNLMEQCWQFHPSDRPKIEAVALALRVICS